MAYSLHEKLSADCESLGDLDLCTVLLMRDHRFPWVILVPRIEGLRDFHDLPRNRAMVLFDEIERVSRILVDEFKAEKINVAALGNQVPQLHVHVIGRYLNDAAWPGPVWNAGVVQDVDQAVVGERALVLCRALGFENGNLPVGSERQP
ncbi:MAG: HIT family protein [Gammaproteobacteria bacterium]|nr:HIT family protein [Gammaproteobacteria bacterium]